MAYSSEIRTRNAAHPQKPKNPTIRDESFEGIGRITKRRTWVFPFYVGVVSEFQLILVLTLFDD